MEDHRVLLKGWLVAIRCLLDYIANVGFSRDSDHYIDFQRSRYTCVPLNMKLAGGEPVYLELLCGI